MVPKKILPTVIWGTLSIEDEVEVCGRGRGKGRNWLSEDTTERDSGGG